MKAQQFQMLKYDQIEEDKLQVFFMNWVSDSFYKGRMTIKNASKALSVYGAAAASTFQN